MKSWWLSWGLGSALMDSWWNAAYASGSWLFQLFIWLSIISDMKLVAKMSSFLIPLWLILVGFFFFFLAAKCWTIAIVALTSDLLRPPWALLFACQSHAHGSYREGGSGLYVVSLKCLIKVSTCCCPPLIRPYAHVLCLIRLQLYGLYTRGGYTGDSCMYGPVCVWKDFISFLSGWPAQAQSLALFFYVFPAVGRYLFAFIPLCWPNVDCCLSASSTANS